MQFLIDTTNDAPAELYRIGKFLVEQFAAVAMPPDEAAEVTAAALAPTKVTDGLIGKSAAEVRAEIMAAPPPPPATIPAPPSTITDVVGDDDPEVEIDDEGTVTALTTSAQLPAAPPPPAAPPAPLAAAPSAGIPAATPLPPGPAVAAELDSRGYPWDGRIHASNRAKKIDGSWKNKRGVDANLVVACEAQNKPGNALTPVASTTAAPAPLTVPAAASPAISAPAAAPPAPTAPPPPPPTAGNAAPAAVAPAAIDFRGLMQKIQQAQASKKLTDAQVNAALLTVGLQPQDMAQLIGNALYIASVNAAIDACLSS